MSLRFCANLNFLFCENGPNIFEKFRLAKAAGFRGIELACPEELSSGEVVAALKNNGLEVALLNMSTKPEAANGCASLPNFENEFRANFLRTMEYAKAFNCKKIHILAGKPPTLGAPENDETYLRNLQFAGEQLESTGIIGVIEPINNYSLPGYYLSSYEKALNILKKLNNSNIKLLMDLFHLQLIKGNITNTLNDLKSHIGHAQVSGLNVTQIYGQNISNEERKNRLVSEQYLIFVPSSAPFKFSLSSHLDLIIIIESARFGGGVVSFYGAFVCCFFGCVYSLCDIKVNLCDVYFFYSLYLPVFGTWQAVNFI